MLVACRLAGLSALEGHYAGVRVRAQRALTRNLLASKAAQNKAFRGVGRARCCESPP